MALFVAARDKNLIERMEEDRLIEGSRFTLEINASGELFFYYVLIRGKSTARGLRGQPYDYYHMACATNRERAITDGRAYILEQIRKDNDRR